MDDSVKKFQARRDARIKKRREDEWITMKGTHVLLDDDGNIAKGPQRLKDRNKETNWTQRYKTKSNKPEVVHRAENEAARAPYEKIPYRALAGGKYATPEEKKQKRETVSRFMKEAKVGDVYEVGGGVGSLGGKKFEIVQRGGGPYLSWVREAGDGYSKPVQMSSTNVLKYIANGAKLVSRK